MRIIILLQPTNKRGTKGEYTKFREYLRQNGFSLMGPELYMRITANRKAANRYISKLQEKKPSTGTVYLLTLTEKQFNKIIYLTGEASYQEVTVGNHCHICL